MLTTRDHAGARDECRAGRIVCVLVAGEQAFGQRFGAAKKLHGLSQHAAGGVTRQDDGDECLACVIELGAAHEPAAGIVLVAHICLAAARAAGADRLQQAGFAVDAGVAVGGALAEAVGEHGQLGRGKVELDLLDAGASTWLAGFVKCARHAAHAQDRAPGTVVGVGGQTSLARPVLGSSSRRGGEGNSREMVRPRLCRAADVGGFGAVGAVVVAPDAAVGVGGGDEVAQPGKRALVLMCVAEAPERAGDCDHTPKAAAAARCVLEAEAAALRIGDFHQLAVAPACEAEEFAAGHADLEQLAARIEVQRAPVGPDPAIACHARTTSGCRARRDRTAGGVGMVVAARLGTIRGKHETCAVGLDDVQLFSKHVKIGLIGQPPAAPEQTEGRISARLRAVVMAHDLDAQHAGKCGQVGFALVLVAGDDVDRIACSVGDTVRAFLACWRLLTAGVGGSWITPFDRDAVRVGRARLGQGLCAACGEKAAAA